MDYQVAPQTADDASNVLFCPDFWDYFDQYSIKICRWDVQSEYIPRLQLTSSCNELVARRNEWQLLRQSVYAIKSNENGRLQFSTEHGKNDVV